MARGLALSTFVDINTAIAAGGVLRTEFGTGLLVTLNPNISAGGSGKVRQFRDHAAALAVVGSGAAAEASEIWFAREGVKNLFIGRWAETAVATLLRGSAPGAVADLAVANAAFIVDGTEVTVDLFERRDLRRDRQRDPDRASGRRADGSDRFHRRDERRQRLLGRDRDRDDRRCPGRGPAGDRRGGHYGQCDLRDQHHRSGARGTPPRRG